MGRVSRLGKGPFPAPFRTSCPAAPPFSPTALGCAQQTAACDWQEAPPASGQACSLCARLSVHDQQPPGLPPA